MKHDDWFGAREESAAALREEREEDDAEIVAKARQWDVVRGLRAQRERTQAFARQYLAEDGPGGRRERECLDVVAGLNLQIRKMNAQLMGKQ